MASGREGGRKGGVGFVRGFLGEGGIEDNDQICRAR